MTARFYTCPLCQRPILTMSDGGNSDHDCAADTRAWNIFVLHSEGNHSRCQPNCED